MIPCSVEQGIMSNLVQISALYEDKTSNSAERLWKFPAFSLHNRELGLRDALVGASVHHHIFFRKPASIMWRAGKPAFAGLWA